MNFPRVFNITAPRLLALLSGIVSTGVCVIHAVQYFSLYHEPPFWDFTYWQVSDGIYSIHKEEFIQYPFLVLPPWIAFFGWNRWPRVVYPRLLTLFVAIGVTAGHTLYALDTNYFTTTYRNPLVFISGMILLPAWAIWFIVKVSQIFVSILKRFTYKDDGPLASENSERTENNEEESLLNEIRRGFGWLFSSERDK